jgi:hypothetical protein
MSSGRWQKRYTYNPLTSTKVLSMSSKPLAKAVRSHGNCCFIETCSEGKCKVELPSDGIFSCISGTQYQANHDPDKRLCDCIVFWSRAAKDIAIAVELKGGSIPANKALDQLQGGADLVEQLTEQPRKIRFFAVLVLRRVHAMETRILRRRRISFRGQAQLVSLARCGDKLAEKLRLKE